MDVPFKFETLDTSYVSLAALIRFLREKEFTGRVNIVLDTCETEVFLYGAGTPSVWEKDYSTGREAQGEAAMQRLMVRARDPGGVITIYEETADTSVEDEASGRSHEDEAAGLSVAPLERAASMTEVTPVERTTKTPVERTTNTSKAIPTEDALVSPRPDLSRVIAASSHLFAAVERAVLSTGADFAAQLQAIRLEIADDYPLLDPTVGGFEYENSQVTLEAKSSVRSYVQSVTECLRRLVNQVAKQTEERRFRERVAVELAVTTRQQPNGLGEFATLLDRIAGTRVI